MVRTRTPLAAIKMIWAAFTYGACCLRCTLYDAVL